MAWKDELQDASFRGITFECISIKDAVSKTNSIHQAPYSDSAYVEDMGKEPRKITIQAVFSGEYCKSESDGLIDALNERGTGELVHPIYGVCSANVVSYGISHDADSVDVCSISIDFIVSKEDHLFFTPITATQENIDTQSIVASPLQALDTALDVLEKQKPNEFFNIINELKSNINLARSYLNLTKTTIENVLSPSQLITSFVDDLSQLITFDTHISAISKWRDLVKRIQRFKKLFEHHNHAEVTQAWRATQLATAITVTQSVIEQTRKELAHQSQTSFTPLDLAVIRQHNRKLVQEAINEERRTTNNLTLITVDQIQVYKNVADQVHTQIQQLIEQRPPLITTQITTPCTLHWLAHQLYGDYTRANEILRLNPKLSNPALLLTGMELNVYAR